MSAQKKFLPKLYPVKKEIDKTWFVLYYDQQGNRQKKYGNLNHLHTLAERELEASRIMEDIKQTVVQYSPAKPTQTILINDLEEVCNLHSVGWAQKTKEAYHTHLYHFAKWYKLNGYPVADITMAQQFLNSITFNGRTATTRNNYRNNLKTMWGWLIKFKGYKINIFKEVKKLPETRATKEWFRPWQVKEITEYLASNDPVLLLACRIMFHCFTRPNELRQLKVKHLVWETKRLRVESKYAKIKRIRHIPIPDSLLQDLYIMNHYQPEDFIFGRTGTPGPVPYGRDEMSKRHARHLEGLGFDSLVFYGWKNTGAVKMLCQDHKNIRYVSKCMGHHSLDMTDKYFESLGVDDMGMEIIFPEV